MRLLLACCHNASGFADDSPTRREDDPYIHLLLSTCLPLNQVRVMPALGIFLCRPCRTPRQRNRSRGWVIDREIAPQNLRPNVMPASYGVHPSCWSKTLFEGRYTRTYAL